MRSARGEGEGRFLFSNLTHTNGRFTPFFSLHFEQHHVSALILYSSHHVSMSDDLRASLTIDVLQTKPFILDEGFYVG